VLKPDAPASRGRADHVLLAHSCIATPDDIDMIVDRLAAPSTPH
jgi:hypothetical protein